MDRGVAGEQAGRLFHEGLAVEAVDSPQHEAVGKRLGGLDDQVGARVRIVPAHAPGAQQQLRRGGPGMRRAEVGQQEPRGGRGCGGAPLGALRPIPEGARLRIRERVAGIPCVAEGPVAERIEGRRLTWTARARYRLLGLEIPIDEGVAWELGPRPEGSVLAAHVWARFPRDRRGRLVRRLFEGPLRGPERDRQHALRELTYLKERLESACAPTRGGSGPADPMRRETS